jgi:hypothetical protein
MHSSSSIDTNELAAKILLRCDGLVNAVCLSLKIPIEGADNDPMMSAGLQVKANEVTPIEFEQRAPLHGCECQHFRIWYGIACFSCFRCRQHIMTELS